MQRPLRYLTGLTVPMNTAPVSTTSSRPALMPASIVSAEVSGSRFTLLWVDGTGDATMIEAAVIDVNRRLSHPEQVRRWAVLPNDLSIEGGELTANLKLRRHMVEARFRGVIDSLYEGHPTPPTRLVNGAEVRT